MFEKCIKGVSKPLPISDEFKEKYLSLDSNDLTGKRELIFEIMEYYQKKYFENFSNMFKLFEGLKNFEIDFLYKYLPYYRDHFIHSFQIFLLGYYIVDRANYNESPIEFLSKENFDRFLRTWFLISFYHDIGYIVQKLIKIGEAINSLYFQNVSGVNISKFQLNLSDKLKDIFMKYLEDISYSLIIGEKVQISEEIIEDCNNNIILNELIENFKERNHGIISALFLYYTSNLDINYIEDDKQYLYLKEFDIACSAIATHDLEKRGKIHLSFNDNPFSCLLILCDNIQEWNRPFNLDINNKPSDIWDDINLEINQKENLFKFVFKLKPDSSDLNGGLKEEILTNFIDSIERIFSKSIISGPQFSFVIKNEEIVKKIDVNHTDKKYYVINKNL